SNHPVDASAYRPTRAGGNSNLTPPAGPVAHEKTLPPNGRWAAGLETDSWSAGSRHLLQVKPVQIHHLVPRGDKVLHELLLRIGAAIDFGQGAQLGVGAKDKVHAGGGPL